MGRSEGAPHLGIILDGNRRYALDVLLWCAELSIPAVTLWVLSTENFQRTPTEVSGILSAVEAKLVQLAGHPRIRRLGVRVRAVGKLDLLPDSLLSAIRVAQEATAAHRGMLLTIAVAYGGRQEIIDAVQALLREQAKQGEDLDTRAVPLRARSGFLLWQSAYSEFYFCDVHWPAFRRIDFLRAVRAFQQRDRRFGS